MRFRIDFGLVFPGLILFICGLVVLAVLALAAVVGFFFSFLPGWEAVGGVILQLTLIPGALLVAGVIVMVSGVSWWGSGESWWSRIARARASEDALPFSQRVGEIFGIAVTTIVFLFLYLNQLRGVAFFTSAFGATEQFLFYAPLFVGMALSLARAVYGHKNGLRPFDSVNALFLAFAAFWLLSVFPFDFTHLGDMFPSAIQFLFSWIPNDLGRLLLFIAGIGSLANFVYTTALYTAVRNQLHYLAYPKIMGRA